LTLRRPRARSGGRWAIWSIGVDGGNLHKVVDPEAGAIYPLISPKGDGTLAFTSSGSLGSRLTRMGADVASLGVPLTGDRVGNLTFSATSWSSDGARIAGSLAAESGRVAGVGVYDIAAKATTLVSSDDTLWVEWLADNRRLVYFTKNGWELVVVDTVTKSRTSVDVRLPGRSISDTFAISPDNRTIYYGAVRAEADIWIMERK